MTTTMTPRETDMALAELWREMYRMRDKLGWNASTLLRLAGAKYYYRGRQRVTDMKLSEAIEILNAEITRLDAYKASHKVTEADGWERTDWTEWSGLVRGYDADAPAETLAERDTLLDELHALQERADDLEATYTGWSRFFLVTSSPGHVHSSMSCSTCYPTTRFGWMPELSGHTEAEAVDELGPTLCTVCFPSAPVDWTTGKKLTKAQAEKKAA
jgi:hypothetical protein